MLRVSKRRPRPRLTIVEATVADESGSIRATWFNQPWVADQLEPGLRVRLIGTVRRGSFAVRSHELAGGTGEALVPVYRATEDVTPKKLRELVSAALDSVRDVPDPLPAGLKARRALPLKADALHTLHRPRSLDEAERARSRLAFEELLVLQLGLARRRAGREADVAPALDPPGELASRYRSILPFELTPDQEQAIAEIDADLVRTVPMERLLQGDVGSGKTVVALYALLRAVESGRLGALMAPTETLAEQHFLTARELLRPARRLGRPAHELRRQARPRAGCGREHPRRHARADPGGRRPRQPRRRRRRRAAPLRGRAAPGTRRGRTPHVLHMTATPIPRTLALTVYGDLNVTEITRPPADRKPIVTAWVGAERSGRGLPAPVPAPRRGPAGVRRLPADRGVGDVGRARGRSRGRAPAPRRAARLPRRAPARTAPARRAARADGLVQGLRARRARGDDGDRGRRRRPERDDHDRPGGRPLRPRPAPPAPGPGRAAAASSRTACSSRDRARS